MLGLDGVLVLGEKFREIYIFVGMFDVLDIGRKVAVTSRYSEVLELGSS